MEEGRLGRRRHSVEFKQQVLAECARPGASVAGVALTHRINANLVQKWRRQARGDGRGAPRVDATFVPVTVSSVAAPAAPVADSDIRIELRRGATALAIRWPVSAGADCAVWLRELLR
jgi:transposase